MIEGEARQTCRTCSQVKHVAEFDVRTDTRKASTQCKRCRRAYQNERLGQRRRARPHPSRLIGTTDTLQCTRCGHLKPAAAFPPRRRGQDRLQTWCRECFAEAGAKYYAEHRDRVLERVTRTKRARATDLRSRLLQMLEQRPCIDCGERDPGLLAFELSAGRTMTLAALVHCGRRVEAVLALAQNAAVRCRRCRGLTTRGHDQTAPTTTHRLRTASYATLNSPPDGRMCRRCNHFKPLAEFAPRYRELPRPGSLCRQCQSDYHRDWYRRNRERVIERVRRNRVRRQQGHSRRTIVHLDARRRRWEYLLTHPCIDCGESDPVVLEFDHRTDKRAAIVDLMRNHASWDEIVAEIEKCDVRCANCHRRRTARTRGYYRELNDPLISRDPGRD